MYQLAVTILKLIKHPLHRKGLFGDCIFFLLLHYLNDNDAVGRLSGRRVPTRLLLLATAVLQLPLVRAPDWAAAGLATLAVVLRLYARAAVPPTPGLAWMAVAAASTVH